MIVLQQIALPDLRPLEVPKGPFDVIECALIGKVILHLGDEIPSLVEVRVDDDVGFYGIG